MYKTIQAGIEFLDNSRPEWWNLIDIETLELVDGDHCVLGQVFKAEADTLGYMNGYSMHLAIMDAPWLWDHAFSINNEIEYWDELQDAWVEAIRERRELISA